MDCNGCKYLNITESEQRKLEKGNHIPHVCTLYDKQVFHYGNREMGYDPYIIHPCKECKEDTNEVIRRASSIAGISYNEMSNIFSKVAKELETNGRKWGI